MGLAMAGKYFDVGDDWFRIVWRKWKLRCCTCGLTHTLDFRREPDGQLMVKIDVDKRATAAARRGKKNVKLD
jgi:hypothetical protein